LIGVETPHFVRGDTINHFQIHCEIHLSTAEHFSAKRAAAGTATNASRFVRNAPATMQPMSSQAHRNFTHHVNYHSFS
jgi:hypothetical protein